MPPDIAAVVFALGILGLFWLDRDRTCRVSPALWIPVAWILLASSRMVSEWLEPARVMESPAQFLEGSPLDRLVLTALLAVGLLVLVARGPRTTPFLRANGPILLFFLYGAVSVLWSDYPDVALKRWIKGVGNVVMVLVILTDPDPPAAVKRLLARLGFLLIPASVLLIKYYPELGTSYQSWSWTLSYNGVATGKNGLGYVCLIFGLASLWRVLQAFPSGVTRRTARPLLAHAAVLAMTLWLFWKADSSTSLGCFLIGGGLMVLTSRRGLLFRPRAMHIATAAIVFFCSFGLFLDPDAGLVQAMGRDTTLTGRTQLWEDVLRLTVDPWFGAGFESFWLGERAKLLWAQHWWHPNQAHNGYLEVFLDLGWLGVALLGLLIVWGYRNVVASLRRDAELGRLRLTYFVVAVLYNLTEAAFKVMHPVWIAFLLAAAVAPELRRRKESGEPVTPV
jgi:O-antigen ligase